MRTTSVRILGSIALTLCIGACTSSGTGDSPGSAGSNGQGSAGSGSQGTAGGQGSGGTQGSAGTGTQGTGGTQGSAGTGTQGTGGTQGTAGGGQGTAGAGGAQGTAGAGGAQGTAGAGGAQGTAGTMGSGGTGTPVLSAGCNMPPAQADAPNKFVQKIVMVTGVPADFIANYPLDAGTTFTWTKRNYYVRIPMGYDPTKAYPVDMAGTGCAGGETTGSGGEYTLPSSATGQPDAIQIGLSYDKSSKANPSCIAFTDDYTNSPEPAYISSVIDDVAAHYCVDKNRFFMNGYSSGAFEASMAGGANADKLRAIGLQIGGGMRMKHPPYSTHPIAAMFVVGLLDQGNPIGPLATPLNDTIGSVAARDEILKRNGCVDAATTITDTCAHGAMVAAAEPNPLPCQAGVMDGDTYGSAPNAMWDAAYPKCHMYTGCPAKYPVVWCPLLVNHGNGPNPMGTDGGATVENYRRAGMWKFFSSLPE
jgi:hypothetical protein